MFELYFSCCFTDIFEYNFFLMFFSTLDKTKINKGFKDDLTFSLINSDRELRNSALITKDFNDFSLIFEFLTMEFDFSSHRKS